MTFVTLKPRDLNNEANRKRSRSTKNGRDEIVQFPQNLKQQTSEAGEKEKAR